MVDLPSSGTVWGSIITARARVGSAESLRQLAHLGSTQGRDLNALLGLCETIQHLVEEFGPAGTNLLLLMSIRIIRAGTLFGRCSFRRFL